VRWGELRGGASDGSIHFPICALARRRVDCVTFSVAHYEALNAFVGNIGLCERLKEWIAAVIVIGRITLWWI